jgi:hypothetical protein
VKQEQNRYQPEVSMTEDMTKRGTSLSWLLVCCSCIGDFPKPGPPRNGSNYRRDTPDCEHAANGVSNWKHERYGDRQRESSSGEYPGSDYAGSDTRFFSRYPEAYQLREIREK